MADNTLNMVSPVTAETFAKLNFNAGMLLANFDYSAATDAASLMELIVSEEVQRNSWLGATRGGINVRENRGNWEPGMDGKRMSFVGAKQFDNADPRISGTLLEYSPRNVQLVSGAADVTTSGQVDTVQPRATIKVSDYLTNVVFVGNIGPEGLYLVELKNAMCVTGMNSQSTDKDVGTLPFEFAGHSASPVFTDELPIVYKFFGVSAG